MPPCDYYYGIRVLACMHCVFHVKGKKWTAGQHCQWKLEAKPNNNNVGYTFLGGVLRNTLISLSTQNETY